MKREVNNQNFKGHNPGEMRRMKKQRKARTMKEQ